MMGIDKALLATLAGYSTPSILNGLKRLGVAPDRFETVDRAAIGCMAPALGVRVGFAATRTVATRRSGQPSASGLEVSVAGLLDVCAPRFLVVENVGEWQGPVCIWGDVAAHISLALECAAGLTNGPVRDLPEMEAAGFLTFAGGAGPGGGHVDLVSAGGPVTVGGMTVHPGDLLHGDRHGIVKIPLALAPELPAAIAAVEAGERTILDLCRSPDFSVEALRRAMSVMSPPSAAATPAPSPHAPL